MRLTIINLGPYQPSNEVMLKFYGYYKQATVGPCNDIKPNFWDVIRRAKWEAWHKLGIMGEEEAMTRYVDELKQVHINVCQNMKIVLKEIQNVTAIVLKQVKTS